MRRFTNLFAACLLLAGCGAYKEEIFEEIRPDETAYLIKLEGDSGNGQVKFQSVDFLEQHRVATKRITIPQRKQETGRMWYDYKWIPTARVVKISRAPVTREWTDDPNTGTSSKSEKLRVESRDSVGFAVGATIMARVSEEDTSKFTYYFGGKQLNEIIDTNIRGFTQKFLSEQFGGLNLEACKIEKGNVFRQAQEEMMKKFEPMGITIEYFGSSEGLTFENPEIQTAIDRQVKSEAEITTQKNEKLAQDEVNKQTVARQVAQAEAQLQSAKLELEAQKIRNERLIEAARAEAEAAAMLQESRDAVLLKLEVYEREKRADAAVEMARNFNEIKILPADSPLLMNLGK